MIVFALGEEVVAQAAGTIGQAVRISIVPGERHGGNGQVVEHPPRPRRLQTHHRLVADEAAPRLIVVQLGDQFHADAAVALRKGLGGQDGPGPGE